MESHNSHLYMSLTKVLVFLDCVRWEGHDFLEDQVKSLQPSEEFKKLITALSEQISAFEDHIWELALSEELAEEEVALHVNLALTAARPVVGNYFSGVLEGLMGRLRIKIHEDENPLAPPRKVWRNASPRSSGDHPCQPLLLRGVSLEACMSDTVWSMQTVGRDLMYCPLIHCPP